MNILHVIGSMDPTGGGTCQAIRSSLNSLQGHTGVREVVCLDDPNANFLGKDPFTVHVLGPGKGIWCYSSKLSPWLDENLQRYDVVIINGLWLYLSYAVSKAIKRLKRRNNRNGEARKCPKLFIMPHGMLDPYFQRAPERKLKAIRNWLYWKLIEAEVVNSADGLLFTCETEMKLAREPFRPYKPKREVNFGFGIEQPPVFDNHMSEAFYDKCPQVINDPYLLFISRIHTKKGVDLLINAYASILKEMVLRGVHLPKLVIAGPGLNTAYGQKIEKIVTSDLSLSSMIFFPGMLKGDAKWGAIYGCEAFVLPSHQENFGIAVVEALACRKPVLISNQVNIWKEIENVGGGIIADDTIEGTIKLLRSWVTLNTAQKRTMQQLAYTAYEKFFEIGSASKKFLDAISS
jgi:glycosyltransferase involved in cell wall biosynthesis